MESADSALCNYMDTYSMRFLSECMNFISPNVDTISLSVDIELRWYTTLSNKIPLSLSGSLSGFFLDVCVDINETYRYDEK